MGKEKRGKITENDTESEKSERNLNLFQPKQEDVQNHS